MPVVEMKRLYQDAQEHSYILGAFNVFNLDTATAVLRAAQEMQSPLILQISMGARGYVYDYREFVKLLRQTAEYFPVAVSINHDHCPTEEAAREAVDAGVCGVMFDGSQLPFEENIRRTRSVAAYAHEKGVFVEAELGRLAGFEDETFAERTEFTDPGQAEEFVRETGCDALAVSVGTSHGGVQGDGWLSVNYEILKQIHGRIPGTPLVLHGAASLSPRLIDLANAQGGRIPYWRNCPEWEIKKTADFGVCKANMDVDNFLVYTEAVRRALNEAPEKYDPRGYLRAGRDAWQREVEHKLAKVTCSAGKNWWKRQEETV